VDNAVLNQEKNGPNNERKQEGEDKGGNGLKVENLGKKKKTIGPALSPSRNYTRFNVKALRQTKCFSLVETGVPRQGESRQFERRAESTWVGRRMRPTLLGEPSCY